MTAPKKEAIHNLFRVGDTVQLIELETEQYNGSYAKVVGPFLIDTERWPIELYNDDKSKLAIKTINLKRVMPIFYKPSFSSGIYGNYQMQDEKNETKEQKIDDEKEYDSTHDIVKFKFAVIADQDKDSRSKNDNNTFVSYLLFGEIRLNLSMNKLIDIQFIKPNNCNDNVIIDKQTNAIELKTDVGTSKNRGAEFSVLNKHILKNKYNTHLITGGDKTGILYEIDNSTFNVSVIGKLIKTKSDKNNKYGQLIFVDKNNLDENNDANVDGKGLKIEWMTRKKDKNGTESLIIGSNVLEKRDWYNNGKICEEGRNWIAEYNENGNIKTFNWTENYNKLKYAVGAVFPGWIHIEACIWSEIHKKWFISPRYFCINAPYDALFGNYGCNLLLIADENFNDIEYVNIKLSKPKDNNMEYVNSLYTNYDLLGKQKNKMYNGCDWDGAKNVGILTMNECDKNKINNIQKDVAKSLFYTPTGARGISCAQFVPKTNENVIIAVRTLEKANGEYGSWICIFDIKGNVFVEDCPFKTNVKYEGLVIL